MPLSIVMPAYNEEENIGLAVERAIAVAKRFGREYEVVVVDDGSVDGTADVVRSTGGPVRLVQHPRNLGYGAALRTALSQARFDVILFTDADNQFDLDEIERLLTKFNAADVVIGYRSRRSDRLIRRATASAWNLLVRGLFKVRVKDIDCGFKLFRREALAGIDLRSRGAMISTELVVKLARAGRTIAEVEVSHLPRRAGKATGMSPRVVGTALVELVRMYPELSPRSRTAGMLSVGLAWVCATGWFGPAS
jgi:glycosyltransferase involved in cell wall biosynthesis